MPSNKKKRRGVMVPVASMGDIAFLLIIFFLLLSEFNKDQVAQLMLPKSEHVEKLEGKPIAKVDIDENGVIYVDSQIVADAQEVQDRLTNKLKDTVSDEQRRVQFKCDMEIGKPVFEPVLQAIAEAGGIIEAVGKRNNE